MQNYFKIATTETHIKCMPDIHNARSVLLQIFHYTSGMAYVDNKGPFRDRVEFVGNPGRRDGSILIKNLDYNDNGTFTCDAKNPPDIVGRPSSVRLLVFEKGEMGGRRGEERGVSSAKSNSPGCKV